VTRRERRKRKGKERRKGKDGKGKGSEMADTQESEGCGEGVGGGGKEGRSMRRGEGRQRADSCPLSRGQQHNTTSGNADAICRSRSDRTAFRGGTAQAEAMEESGGVTVEGTEEEVRGEGV
jgi:hypothetical protein